MVLEGRSHLPSSQVRRARYAHTVLVDAGATPELYVPKKLMRLAITRILNVGPQAVRKDYIPTLVDFGLIEEVPGGFRVLNAV